MTLWTVAPEAPLSMGFPRPEYWSELPFLSPGDLLNPGIKPISPALQADSLLLSHQGRPFRKYYSSFNFFNHVKNVKSILSPGPYENRWQSWFSSSHNVPTPNLESSLHLRSKNSNHRRNDLYKNEDVEFHSANPTERCLDSISKYWWTAAPMKLK